MHRRDFLTQIAGAAASVAVGSGGALAYTKKRQHAFSPPSKQERIAISSWSLHNYFRATRESTFDLPGPMLALLDLPEMIFDRYKIRHLELCASQFPSTEPAFVKELKYAMVHSLTSVVNLSVDIDQCGPDGAFSDPDREARLAALEAVKPWVDIAHQLGAKSVSVGPGKVDMENLTPTAESYKAVAIYALAKAVHVIVENQNGFGVEHPEELVKVIKLAGPGRLGTLPNLANFPDEPTRARGLRQLFPLATAVCHANLADSSPEGSEAAFDFSPAIEIAKQAGFHGIYTIAFDGPGDPYAGIQKTLDELLRYI